MKLLQRTKCHRSTPITWIVIPLLTLILTSRVISQEVTFSNQMLISHQVENPTSVFSADINGDGDLDIIASFFFSITWYENSTEQGSFIPHPVNTSDIVFATSIFSADLDGDGDNDILSASAGDDRIAWYENLNGTGEFGIQQTISIDADSAYSIFSADLDNDGDNDVVSASAADDKIAWYENTDGLGTFGDQQVISSDADWACSVYCLDIDGDNDIDVLSASRFDDKIAWYENLDGLGGFSQEIIITTDAEVALSVCGIDVDGDGDNDVLTASAGNDIIAWFENTDGAGAFGEPQVITTEAYNVISLISIDLDGDDDNDVVFASALEEAAGIFWCENTDGTGNFWEQQQISSPPERLWAVYSADFDNDGDNDVISAEIAVAVYENANGLGSFTEGELISIDAYGANCTVSADIDGDGDYDVISSSSDFDGLIDSKISWYENIDGYGEFGPKNIITTEVNTVKSIFCVDIDGDGDNDLVSASRGDDKIAWYENTDGTGTFGFQNVISTDADGAWSVTAADLDGDGDQDVLSASNFDNKLAWYENTDGSGAFGEQQIISTEAIFAYYVSCADIDGDEDIDVLAASRHNDEIGWYENQDGHGDFSSVIVISNEVDAPTSVVAVDINGDGDLDVLSSSELDNKIAWYENTDGVGNFGQQQVISSEVERALTADYSDLDNDGDQDIICTSETGLIDIAWFENLDGLGTFGEIQAITNMAQGARSVFSSDIDGDGDSDLISASKADHKIAWYRNELLGLNPLPFNLLSPEDGEVLDSIEIILEWEEVIDPDGDFISYQVYVSEDLENLEENLLSDTTSTNCGFTGEDDRRYWWTVSALDNRDNITWASQVFSFDLETPNSPPAPFNLVHPDSGIFVDSLEVTLVWEETTDPDGDFSSFQVYVSEDLDSLEENLFLDTTSTNLSFTGEYDRQYWWTVSASDERDNITWASQVFSFTLLNGYPPQTFNLLEPDSGSVFDSTAILLQWDEVFDPDNDFDRYRVYVSDSRDSLENHLVGDTTSQEFLFHGENGNQYWWSVSAVDERNNETWANQVYSFTIDITSIEDDLVKLPTDYEITSIYPNPFNPATTIAIGLPEPSHLKLNVYNILGQHISTLANNPVTAGYHNFILDGSLLPSGIYFVSANVQGKLSDIKKVVLMK